MAKISRWRYEWQLLVWWWNYKGYGLWLVTSTWWAIHWAKPNPADDVPPLPQTPNGKDDRDGEAKA